MLSEDFVDVSVLEQMSAPLFDDTAWSGTCRRFLGPRITGRTILEVAGENLRDAAESGPRGFGARREPRHPMSRGKHGPPRRPGLGGVTRQPLGLGITPAANRGGSASSSGQVSRAEVLMSASKHGTTVGRFLSTLLGAPTPRSPSGLDSIAHRIDPKRARSSLTSLPRVIV